MSNPISIIVDQFRDDMREAAGWDSSVEVFNDGPRTQPSSRTYGIIKVDGLSRVSGNTSPTADHYQLTLRALFRFGDESSSLERLTLRTETWLKLRGALTPLGTSPGGSHYAGVGFSCLVTDGDLSDSGSPDEPDTELSLTFQCQVRLDRGTSNIS